MPVMPVMPAYEEAMDVMSKLFSRNYQFALATCYNDIPSLRYVGTYFDGKAFYSVTYNNTKKVEDIELNPCVALTSRHMHTFNCAATNIGHPLEPENAKIREKLTSAFKPWYFKHNDESDDKLCIIKIVPTSGFFHLDGTGYKVDFIRKSAQKFPYIFDISLTQE